MIFRRLTLFLSLGFALFLFTSPVLQQEIPVACDTNELVDAINTANADPDETVLSLEEGCVYSFLAGVASNNDSALPRITTPVVINGNNAVFQRNNALVSTFRLLYVSGGASLTLNNVQLSGGNGSVGGAVFNAGTLTVYNSLLSGNSGSTGGAIYNSGTLTVVNSTLAGNEAAAGQGGAVYNEGTATFTNSIVWGNSSSIEGDSVTVNTSLVEGGADGTGNLNADPIFLSPVDFASAPSTAGDYRVKPSSPAVDSGSNAAALGNDLDNLSRIVGAAVDMGAYENRICEGYVSGLTIGASDAEALVNAVDCANLNPGPDVINLTENTGYIFLQGDVLSGRTSALPPIRDSLTINGNDATILRDSPFNFRLINIENNATVTLDTVNLDNGYSNENGGGIYIYPGSTLNFTNSKVTDSTSASSSGAIHIPSGAVATVTNSSFNGNMAVQSGGAIYNLGTLTVENSSFTNNEVANLIGGAIFSLENLMITGSTFINNSAFYGGALFLDDGGTLINNVFQSNEADVCGAMCVDDTVLMVNNLITGNETSSNGAAFINDGAVTMINSTIAGNMGAEILNNSGTVVVRNSIIWDPSPLAGNVDISHSLVYGGWAGQGVLASDPLFQSSSDFRLKLGSPAINTGIAAFLPQDTYDFDGDGDVSELFPYDLDGYSRFNGSAVDMGAFETINGDLLVLTPQQPVVFEGQQTIYTVQLSQAPTSGTVQVTLVAAGSQVTLSPSTLTFTTENATTPQPVTVTAVEDSDVEGTNSALIDHVLSSAGDSRFNGYSQQFTVIIRDNDEQTTTNLLINGGFEDYPSASFQPSSWNSKNLSGERGVCNGTTTVTPFGACAYRFKGVVGERAQLNQPVTLSAEMGNTFHLSLYYRTNRVAPNLLARVRVTYSDAYVATFSKRISTVYRGADYQQVTLPAYTVASGHGAVTKVTVTLLNRKTSGTVFVDEVMLTRDYLLPRDAQDGFPALPPSN